METFTGRETTLTGGEDTGGLRRKFVVRKNFRGDDGQVRRKHG